MNTQDALVKLSHATADAVGDVLRGFCGDDVTTGSVAVVPKGANALTMLRPPIIAVDVSYVDGVTGGNLFAMTHDGARKLAAAVSPGAEIDAIDGGLSEAALAAIADVTEQMMAAAAAATGELLGTVVEIAEPRHRLLEKSEAALDDPDQNVHITSVAFEIGGEACRLVQLVPKSFPIRMASAIDARREAAAPAVAPVYTAGAPHDPAVAEAIRGVNLRVWAELGRTQMVTRDAVGLAPGAVVDLDRAVDDPVDLYVNGCRFGTGRLTVDADEQWVVEIVGLEPRETLTF